MKLLKKSSIKKMIYCCFCFIFLSTFSQEVGTLNRKAMASYKKNQKEALTILQKALKIAKEHQNLEEISRTQNNLGIVYRDLGEFEKAKKLSEKALKIAKDSLVKASILNNIGACNRKLGLYKDAIASYLKSLAIYEAKKNSKNTATLNNNIAVVYSYLNLNKKSLAYYKKAKMAFEKLNNQKGISQTYNNIAIIYANEGKLKEALRYFRYSLHIEKKLDDKKGIAESTNNVGSVHYYLGAIDSAVYYFKKSAKIERIIGNFAGVSASYNNIAQVLIENHQLKHSKKYIDSAFMIAKKYQVAEDTENALLNYADYFEKINNPKKALSYYKKYLHYNDSLRKKSNIKSLQEIESKYQTAKKEKKIAQQKEELLAKELTIKTKRIQTLLLIGALLFLGIISFGFYKRNQFKRIQLQKELDLKEALAKIKTQNKLQEQRLRISRDLHDNIGSQLTFIISSIDNLKYIPQNAQNKLKEKLSNISQFTSDTISQLRDTIWAMNKNEIIIEDLHTRILSFVEKAKIATQNQIEFNVTNHVKEVISLSSIKGMNLFRIVQEAINNALKYAEASKINIEITSKNKQLIISITDNGKGFDIAKVDLGNGLSNIEKRINEIGGKVFINSKPNTGTEIKIICNL